MRALFVMTAALLLSACATPRPVADVATLVAKMSNDMDQSVTNYVGSLKTLRKLDAARLQKLQANADKARRPVKERLSVLMLADESRTVNALNTLAVAPEPDPMRVAILTVPPIASDPLVFDSAPLKAVSNIAGDIARPRGAEDQLKVLLAFAKIVNEDLKKATDDNNSTPPTP